MALLKLNLVFILLKLSTVTNVFMLFAQKLRNNLLEDKLNIRSWLQTELFDQKREGLYTARIDEV